MSDAVVRTLCRVYVTRRHLLEWVTAAQAKAGLGLELRGFYRRMAGGLVLTVATAAVVGWRRYDVLVAVMPVLLLWLGSPALARWVSLPGLAVPNAPPFGGRHTRASIDRPPDLALLHDIRGSGGPLAASGQLPGRSQARGGPPDVAHQPGSVPALDGGRPGFRLDGHARNRGPAGSHAPDHAAARALPRPLLQLVRHDGPPPARSAIRVIGR
mgnify:CR=1 FL=1